MRLRWRRPCPSARPAGPSSPARCSRRRSPGWPRRPIRPPPGAAGTSAARPADAPAGQRSGPSGYGDAPGPAGGDGRDPVRVGQHDLSLAARMRVKTETIATGPDQAHGQGDPGRPRGGGDQACESDPQDPNLYLSAQNITPHDCPVQALNAHLSPKSRTMRACPRQPCALYVLIRTDILRAATCLAAQCYGAFGLSTGPEEQGG